MVEKMSGQTSSKLSMSLDELIAKSKKNTKQKLKNVKNTSLSINRKNNILTPEKGLKTNNGIIANKGSFGNKKLIKTINKSKKNDSHNSNLSLSKNNNINNQSKLFTVRVSGFSGDIDVNNLKSHFGVCGKVVHVNMLKDGGAAYIAYSDSVACASALRELNGTKIRGSELIVEKGRPVLSASSNNAPINISSYTNQKKVGGRALFQQTNARNFASTSFFPSTYANNNTNSNRYYNSNNVRGGGGVGGFVRSFGISSSNNGMHNNNNGYSNNVRVPYVYDIANTNQVYVNKTMLHNNSIASSLNYSSPTVSPYSVTNRLSNQSTGLVEKGAVNHATVIVSNVPLDLTAQEIQDAFCCVGTIARTEVLLNSNGKHTGRAAVVYESRAFAEEAVRRFDGGDLNNNKIRVFLE